MAPDLRASLTAGLHFVFACLLLSEVVLAPAARAADAEVEQAAQKIAEDLQKLEAESDVEAAARAESGEDADLAEEAESAEEEIQEVELDEAQRAEMLLTDSLVTLNSLVTLRDRLQADIAEATRQLEEAPTDIEKADLKQRIESFNADLDSTQNSISEIATGADISTLTEAAPKAFNFQQELFSLLEPLMKELKGLTSHVRAKAALRDKITYFSDRIPVAEDALSNLDTLLAKAEGATVKRSLTEMQGEWQNQLTFMTSQLQSAEFQLTKLESSEVSLSEASQSYFKTFVRKRGLYLGQAILVVLAVLLLGRLVYRGLERFMPGYRAELRSFRTRLFDLLFRVSIILAAILGPMVVFYIAEDWMLFSIGLLLLLGIALTLRTAIPRFWHQIQLFLNIGTVREGERIEVAGLPWRVKQINFFTQLENPTAEIELRVKIDDLVDRRSRPYTPAEPWFPCKRGDWVLLPDERRGKVVGISPELVQMIERGGAHRTFKTQDFLDASPINLSTNFRIKETLGISYEHLNIATNEVLTKLEAFIAKRIEEEGYADTLLNLRVEFENASDSSLDIVVIADFSGQVADIYNRLRRALQRWNVEAAAENGWDIPFPQLTVHRG